MYVLGISGGFDEPDQSFLPRVPVWLYHDAGACLLKDGRVIAAVEQERFNRIKNTTKFPVESIQFCLQKGGIELEQIDRIAYYFKDDFVDEELNLQYVQFPATPLKSCRELLTERFHEFISKQFDPCSIEFVKHHEAHAYSAYYHSGFDSALVIVIDGQGEKESISIYSVKGGNWEFLKDHLDANSLGSLYLQSIRIFGYYFFDEYKVMGLAPYGNPNRFRHIFQKIYRLLPNGEYEYLVPLSKLRSFFLAEGFVPRRKGEVFNQIHKDFAAALQETLEVLAQHVIIHWKKQTGHQRLCIAGGVGHNCTLNGKLAYSGHFQELFVHPAASDSGAALGAALYVSEKGGALQSSKRIPNVYWGPGIASNDELEEELSPWKEVLEYNRVGDISSKVAKLLSEGAVVAWVQGNLEFGPRALGNRSILADPRPEENKSRINAMIKKREAYRPFAPSVLEEMVGTYFELPDCAINLDFMVFNLNVKKDYQKQLGAITHVNGTGRVQTVSKVQNPKYWALIHAFYEITGTPIVLNTSFNNRYEPIVCSEQEAIACFLTTDLDYLILGDVLIQKVENYQEQLLNLIPHFSPTTLLERRSSKEGEEFILRSSAKSHASHRISELMFHYLAGHHPPPQCSREFVGELLDVWGKRYCQFYPQKIHQKLIDQTETAVF